jgi:SAM-dependent methyltransferase
MTPMGTAVSVLLPLAGGGIDLPAIGSHIEHYLASTGFDFEVLPLVPEAGESYGLLLRRGVSETKGSVVVVVDPDLPYSVSAIGDAVAMIQSGVTDVVFGAMAGEEEGAARYAVLRQFLVPILPHPSMYLKAFTSTAAKLIVGETKLGDGVVDLEVAFLANKYGFRVERLAVQLEKRPSRRPAFRGGSLAALVRIRLINRNNGYRAARRCPVCFSNEVWSWAQLPANIVRACKRCKCRYLNQFAEEEEGMPVRRVLRSHAPASEPDPHDDTHSRSAREKTSGRRIALLRKHVASRARVLEIGVRDGSFGLAAAGEYEYVGIDHAPAAARAARGRGLEVYCATIGNFVNTGPAFDAIALFHVFENIADPHDTLGRIKDLLKPGGVLLLATFDTEGLLYLLTERKRAAHNFRRHLILYSRSALIELLEHSGFEIESIGPDFEYRDRRFLRHWIAGRWPRTAGIVSAFLGILPDPLLVGSGSIRIVAKRRGGRPLDVRAIRSTEATHAR